MYICKMKIFFFSIWFWLVDAVKGVPILFRKLWMKSSSVELKYAKIKSVQCIHGFNPLDIVKYKKKAKCTKCGIKLKDAEKELS